MKEPADTLFSIADHLLPVGFRLTNESSDLNASKAEYPIIYYLCGNTSLYPNYYYKPIRSFYNFYFE